MHILRSIVAVVCGYLVMVLLLVLVQDIALGGNITWGSSSAAVLALAAVGSFLAALGGGAFAGWAAPSKPRAHALAQCALVAAETTALIKTGELTGPLWFEALASATLMAGLLLGADLAARRGRGRLAGQPRPA